MTEDQIIESNKLIAEFMGLKTSQYKRNGHTFLITDDERGDGFDFDYIAYHLSWDWLMPVLDKIESTHDENGLRPRVTIDTRFVKIWNHEPIEIHTFDGESKLESAWHAAIDFIKWYNKR